MGRLLIMRVISGEYGGRPLKAAPGNNTRPTTDKVKESMFNLIGPFFNGGQVLDLYSGSGSLGIEAVSRGMDAAVLVDQNFKAVQVINENVQMTKETDKFMVWKKKASQALKQLAEKEYSFDLVFLDPPYAKQEIEATIEELVEKELLNSNALIVCETDANVALAEHYSSYCHLWKMKEYGSTKITVYEVRREE